MSNPYSNPYHSPSGFPAGVPSKPGGPKPKNYLTESIILLICCGGIFAIPAIIYAAQVDSKYNAGDFHGAKDSSDKAKMWCIIAFCIGLVCIGGSVILQFVVLAAEMNGAGF